MNDASDASIGRYVSLVQLVLGVLSEIGLFASFGESAAWLWGIILILLGGFLLLKYPGSYAKFTLIMTGALTPLHSFFFYMALREPFEPRAYFAIVGSVLLLMHVYTVSGQLDSAQRVRYVRASVVSHLIVTVPFVAFSALLFTDILERRPNLNLTSYHTLLFLGTGLPAFIVSWIFFYFLVRNMTWLSRRASFLLTSGAFYFSGFLCAWQMTLLPGPPS